MAGDTAIAARRGSGPLAKVCPLCASSAISPLYLIERYAIKFDVYRCADCDFMFMNPPLDDQAAASLYDEAYFRGSADYSYCDERRAEKYFRYVWDKRIGVIRSHVPSGRMLDVGCSFGGLLSAASRYYEVFGLEISHYAADYAKARSGAEIRRGTLHDHGYPAGFFNVITMIELIEHLPDPAHAIAECHRLLAPDGLLVVQTANMAGFQARIQGKEYAYFMPGHMSYFSKENLTGALLRAGFLKVHAYHPVEFGLVPKLRKSRHTFKSPLHYLRWIRIALYHWAGKIRWKRFCLTSSMVIYARKGREKSS